ncbi:hypothetical protein DSL72_002840 [Monilinia vaccinii-corymbosi]|uniref:Enoyl reductase (ER) domain-containing protein n=1 Tax=Monilinia vaccinii-corymbosi TaxID=61207 RepID=A0A8A3PDJ0_9HELO|nr:hypothetical protein DSL72_002840 [Monilinia vaccinii-corymbosi]
MFIATNLPFSCAVWLNKSADLEVRSAPYTRPLKNEVVIKNGAVAINHADWIKRDMGSFTSSWVRYPCILGYDVSGEVVQVGDEVTRFKVGDRVVGLAIGLTESSNTATKSAFQSYTVLLEHLTSHIPSTLSYEQASVIPLGLSTAAVGLFQKDQLALQLPSLSPKPTGKTVLIWGGSTSVGVNAIQLAVAAGYEVFATASPKNFDLCKKLGASQVFDYNKPSSIPDLINAFKGKITAGAMSIGKGAADACMKILHKCQGRRFISMVSYPVPFSPPPKRFVRPKVLSTYVLWVISNQFKKMIRGVRNKFVDASDLVSDGVGEAIYADFLAEALEKGIFVAAPEAWVIGKGLEFIEKGMDIQREGLSAKKVVVSL